MKRIVLMLIPALVCGLLFSGCNTEKVKPEEKTAGELYVLGNSAGAVKSGLVRAAGQTDYIVFTGDDILSFDIWRDERQIGGQIYFTEGKLNEIISRAELYSELHFLIDDKPVFDPPIRIYRVFSLPRNVDDFDLQFRYEDSNVFLTSTPVDSVYLDEIGIKVEELAANKQKRLLELDVFIAYLKDTGKPVNEIVFDIIVPPPLNSDSLCSCLFDKNVDKVKFFVDNFLSELSEDMDAVQKIDMLSSHLKAYPCIDDVVISETEADPTLYNVTVSFDEYEKIDFVISLMNSCNFDNPLTDLPWLKEKINEITLLFQGNSSNIAIYQCTYSSEKTCFIEDHGNIAFFYDCEGKTLCATGGFTGKNCPDELNIDFSKKKLIWKTNNSN